jgi:hypothetical protein
VRQRGEGEFSGNINLKIDVEALDDEFHKGRYIDARVICLGCVGSLCVFRVPVKGPDTAVAPLSLVVRLDLKINFLQIVFFLIGL